MASGADLELLNNNAKTPFDVQNTVIYLTGCPGSRFSWIQGYCIHYQAINSNFLVKRFNINKERRQMDQLKKKDVIRWSR
jgi:hypothetical protein